MLIDPIVVREERERQQAHLTAMSKGTAAADALLWFSEYAKDHAPELVVQCSARLVASSTPKASEAGAYVTRAARQFEQQILDLAIGMAQSDFEAAERLRRGPRKGSAAS